MRTLRPRTVDYIARHDWTWEILREFADNLRSSTRWANNTEGRMRWVMLGNALFDTIAGRQPTTEESAAQFRSIYKAAQARGAAI